VKTDARARTRRSSSRGWRARHLPVLLPPPTDAEVERLAAEVDQAVAALRTAVS